MYFIVVFMTVVTFYLVIFVPQNLETLVGENIVELEIDAQRW